MSRINSAIDRLQNALKGTMFVNEYFLIGAVLILLAVAPFLLDISHIRLLVQMLIFGLFALGFDFLFGYNGVVSFGHAAFFGLGAYFFAIPVMEFGYTNIWLVVLFAVLATTIVGLAIAGISVRAQETHFAILTLAWAFIILIVVENVNITGAHDGLQVITPDLTLVPGVLSISLFEVSNLYYVIVISLLVVFYLLYRIVNSPFGMMLRGCSANKNRLRYVGVNEQRIRTVSFTVSAAVAGLAGAFQAMMTGYVDPSIMDFLLSGEVIVWTIIGGSGTLIGPVLGAALITLTEDVLTSFISWWHIPLGVIFILFLIYMSEGIVGKVKELW